MAWQSINTAPKNGKPILAKSASYMLPFVVYWGSHAENCGDIPALPPGSTIERYWVLANSEDGQVMYSPDEWQPITDKP